MVQCLPSHGDTRTMVSFEWRHVSHLSLQGKKTWSVHGPMLVVPLWNSRLVDLCEICSCSVRQHDGSCGEDLFINYVGMKKMEIFLDYSRLGRHSVVVSAHPRDFRVLPFSWAGLGVFLFLRPFHKSLFSCFVLPSGDGQMSSVFLQSPV